MTIKDAVKAAIAAMPGNKPFRAAEIPPIAHPAGEHSIEDTTYLSGDQVSRAIRDLPYVQRGFGKCRVKGRRVPQR